MPASLVVQQPAELLAFLFASRPEAKKGAVRQWLKHGVILVNGKSTTRFNHPLQPGDVVSIRAKHEATADDPLPLGLKIVFEDDSLIVIEKPAGLLSMATDAERRRAADALRRRTAYSLLTDHVRRGDRRSPHRVWIVHRLDRETSGLMVFAKTEAAKRALQSLWRTAEKRYLAVIKGCPPTNEGVFSSHLDESRPYKVHTAPPSDETRLAVTKYRVVQRTAAGALVELTLETGRRNQIRVHLADVNCPVVGDKKYGAQTNPARRLALHASYLQVPHPSTGEMMKFESPLPRELARLVGSVR